MMTREIRAREIELQAYKEATAIKRLKSMTPRNHRNKRKNKCINVSNVR